MDNPNKNFWNKVNILGDDDCWEWKRSRNIAGYGWYRDNKIITLSHRKAWSLVNGEIPEGMFICHHCDNPPCCNPKHLFLGTAADNNRDRDKKGRGWGKVKEMRTNGILPLDTHSNCGYNRDMKDKTSPRTNFWKVRLSDDDLALRKRIAQILGKSESQIDRDLWQKEAERIDNDRKRTG